MKSSASLSSFARRLFVPALLVVASGAVTSPRAQDEQTVTVSAAGWAQYGMIFKSSDRAGAEDHDMNKNGIHAYGAQLSLSGRISEKLSGAAGLGVYIGHTMAMSAAGKNGGYAPLYAAPYIAEANATYTFWNEQGAEGKASVLSLRGGYFPYDYNPEVRNLGLYLLRGPVYPGILISGFETKHTLPVANLLGFQLHHQYGAYQQDLLVHSEVELAPFYDISVAYVGNYKPHPSIRLGAGVNLYHLIPVDDEITSGKAWNQNNTNVMNSSEKVAFSGTKLMANAAFDPKPFFGNPSALGAEDLKIYGEIALIGLDNDSIHKALYGDLMHRMPVMVGFNFPMFNFLDHLSLEVEWYGAPYRDDLVSFHHASGATPTPLPPADVDSNLTRDNWKWSLHGARSLGKHVQLSFQLANDHYRPGVYIGEGDNYPPNEQALFSTPKDWYGNLKLAYFF